MFGVRTIVVFVGGSCLCLLVDLLVGVLLIVLSSWILC